MTADRLDAILLFAFVLPVIFRYKILPGEVTPYWLFGLLFAVLTINTALSFFRDGLKGFLKINYEKIRTVLTVSVVTAVIVGVMGGAIVDRGRIAPGQNFGVHDIILQLEAALTKLSDGVNPYDTTYFGTPLEDWHYDELGKPAVNPALYHFVMPPFYLVSAFPLRFISIRLFGFFDGRMPLLLAAVGLIAVLVFYFRKPELKRTAIIFTLLSPATIDFLIEGRSDMFALFFLVLSLYFLGKDRLIASVVVFALGMASKQTVWFALPAYIFLALHHTGYGKKFFVCTAVLTAVLAAVFFPFLAWNPGAFLDSVVFYLSGNTARGYPVSGYGLGMLLYQFGVLRDIHQYYPFYIWQLLVAVPAVTAAYAYIKRRPTQTAFFFWYALILFAVWYTSRYFNNSHLAFISTLLGISALKSGDGRKV